MAETITGKHGTATRIEARSGEVAQTATLAGWLVDAPGQAVWRHYLVAVIHLRPIPGVRPPYRQYPEADYELMVCALDSRKGPRADDIETLVPLRPINVVIHFHGLIDEQAKEIAELAARAIIDGQLPAEPEGLVGAREAWNASVRLTVEHARTGHHAEGMS